MAICRIKKLSNYTVLSNYFIDDKRLSLKAVGLLTRMLRLPDDWDFSVKGLASICKEGLDSIAATINELEKYSYIKKERLRSADGRVGKMCYTIYEVPYDVDQESLMTPILYEKKEKIPLKKSSGRVRPEQVLPERENPIQVIPGQVIPAKEAPGRAVPVQAESGWEVPDTANSKQINTKRLNTSITESYESFSSSSSLMGHEEEKEAIDYSQTIKENVEYEVAKKSLPHNEFDVFDELVDLIIETVSVDRTRSGVKINGEEYPYHLVKKRFMQLNFESLTYVIECMKKTPAPINNMRGYMLSALYNSASTINSYYQCAVWRDNA